MIETAQKKERLLLVAVNTAEESRVRASLEELALLVDTAGGEAVGSIYQNLDHPISATYVGKGKIEEIRQLAAQLDDLHGNEAVPAQPEFFPHCFLREMQKYQELPLCVMMSLHQLR